MRVVVTLDCVVRLWWDDCGRTPRVQFCKQPIGIKRLVRQKGVKGDVLDQRGNAFQVVSLAGQQKKSNRVPKASTKATIFVVSPPRERLMAGA